MALNLRNFLQHRVFPFHWTRLSIARVSDIAYSTIVNTVIDTNVLVAALRSNKGASYRLLSWLPRGCYTLNVSVPLFLEHETALKRDAMVPNLNNAVMQS